MEIDTKLNEEIVQSLTGSLMDAVVTEVRRPEFDASYADYSYAALAQWASETAADLTYEIVADFAKWHDGHA